MNTITEAVQQEIGLLSARIAADPEIRGVILRSGKTTGFCAGADLGALEAGIPAWRQAQSQDELRAGIASAGDYSAKLRALETCGKPVVAAIEGLALGGGLELALACHHRVVADSPGVVLGLPEATIGLMPGAGGTQRLPRLMGIVRALPYLIEGNPIPPDVAMATGVAHQCVAPDAVIDACRAHLRETQEALAPWDAKGFRLPGGGPHSPEGYRSLPPAIARLAAYPDHVGRANILRAVYEGSQVPIDAGLRIETRYFFNTLRNPQAAAMVRTLFHMRRELAKTGTPDYAADLVAAAKKGWNDAAQKLADDGVPPKLISGVARAMQGWPIDMAHNTASLSHWEQPSPEILGSIRSGLLSGAKESAQDFLATRGISNAGLGNLLLVQAGDPVWAY